ncbi:MAG: hypothetical protein MI741_12080 [Rhodospirillales bacterium]|nr:hypothetical protein [Rhodospirillales bacterium]
MNNGKQPFDVGVIVPTTLRPCLERAVRSIFAQDLSGRVQILIGVDRTDGPRDILHGLQSGCPGNMVVTVVDPGHSTSAFSGGVYPVLSGGGLHLDPALSDMGNRGDPDGAVLDYETMVWEGRKP